MKILILGGTGFLGTHLAKKLSLDGNLVVVVGAKNDTITGNIDQYDYKLKDVDLINALIVKYEIDHIIHMSNNLSPSSEAKELTCFLEEIFAPSVKIIDSFLEKKDSKVTFLSSGGTVYGQNNNANEDTELSALNYYAFSKIIFEDYFKLKLNQNKNILVLRPSNPYGPGQNICGKQGIIAISIGKNIAHQPLNIFTNPSNSKNYIYITDFIDISSKLIYKSKGIFNISSNNNSSLNQILNLVEKNTGEKNIIVLSDEKRDFVHSFHIDNTKLLNEIGEYDFTPIDEGIKKFTEYIKNKIEG